MRTQMSLFVLASALLVGCGGSADGVSLSEPTVEPTAEPTSEPAPGATPTPTPVPDADGSGGDAASGSYYNSAFFGRQLTDESQVSCTLENGTTTSCYQLTFIANGAGDTENTGTVGPFCPPTITTPRSESGMGVYDGDTNPGFQSIIDAALNMEADGFDIVDEFGNINTDGRNGSACLAMPFDSTLELVYLIPVVPELRSTPYQISTIESIGFGVNGVPYKGNPPGVAVAEPGINGSGSGNIPSLDHCGGHADPAGYYHWHFVPQAMNVVLGAAEYDYTNEYGVSCANSNIAADDPAAFAGLAKDGFPIYGAYDAVNSVNTPPDSVVPVDQCNGHVHATSEYPDGAYHYHALEEAAPNVPTCLIGSFARNDFRVQ